MTETYGGAMGANSHPAAVHARCTTLDSIISLLTRMRTSAAKADLNEDEIDHLIEDAHQIQACLREASRQQLELLEALEVLLTMLDTAAEKPMRSGSLMCLLAPLVEKLSDSAGAFNSAIC